MKWAGRIAYRLDEPVETSPGIFENELVEYKAVGDLLDRYPRASFQNDGKSVNDNVTFSHVLSIIATTTSMEHMHNFVYATVRGVKYSIETVTPNGNRLDIALGGLYIDRPEDEA